MHDVFNGTQLQERRRDGGSRIFVGCMCVSSMRTPVLSAVGQQL